MITTDKSDAAARNIQSHYRAFRTRRELAGLNLSKADWQSTLSKVNILLRTSQFADAQPKELSVRGKWIRGLGSASAIGRVRSQCFERLVFWPFLQHLYAVANREVQMVMTDCC